ncbi:type II toxin-antitoxin system RelE/ParE family toxin [Crocosphaera sp. XPORK-15E]|uniref:type II toxin-antitoxin system RelE family toxin n=1 Tax=Crocosphaera sp. XPORK-15E TaxID=3110247 RepID=UPI002B1EC622|nr:type II toxin-antitoxin system RelE/ParE family toxin [Crocosphaera sp. XPORK-15E]MEA5533770.1 type II toxin-antitoxin system RelE/ParE family toxin [Crocosphaera sp. XPORK-15E]
MVNYKIKFKTSAAKEFRKLPPLVKQRVKESIDNLQKNPRPSGVVKLKGEDQLYRVRVNDLI